MSGESNLKLIVLFAHELRLAAKRLREVRAAQTVESVLAALKACDAALYHVTDTDPLTVVTLSNTDIDNVAQCRGSGG